MNLKPTQESKAGKTAQPKVQFKIRTLLVLIFLSSFIAMAGSLAHTSFEQDKIVERLERKNVLYDYEFKDGQAVLHRAPPGPSWIKEKLGSNFFARVTHVKLYRKEINNIESIFNLHQLEHLSLFDCDSLTDVSYIEHFKKLVYLDLGNCDGLTDVEPLKGATNLEHLDLFSCANVSDLNCVENLTQLKYLDISNCEEISEFEFLHALKNLETLKLAKSSLSDVSCVLNNAQLRELHLEGCQNLGSVSGLENLEQLQLVNVRGCKKLSKTQVKRLSELIPGANVVSDY